MLESRRHHLIIDLLDENPVVTVRELTEKLGASEATVRRDLLKLARLGKLKKVHGGAEALDAPASPTRHKHLTADAFLAAKERNVHQKRLIARRAAELCEDGESIIINGGSSTYMMADYLVDRKLNILTNSFALALELADRSDNRVTLPGGELYREQSLILSSFENDTIVHYHGSRMFMGTPGIGDFGVMESDPLLIRSEQKLMHQADQLVILADSSKFGKRSNFILCGLDRVDILITDRGADESHLNLFRKNNIEIIIADESLDAPANESGPAAK
jgi:DeoR family ulaG and ulaABCDEF operon transcriptional repressor